MEIPTASVLMSGLSPSEIATLGNAEVEVANPMRLVVSPTAAPGGSAPDGTTGSGRRRRKGNPKAKLAMRMATELRGRGYGKSEALRLAW